MSEHSVTHGSSGAASLSPRPAAAAALAALAAGAATLIGTDLATNPGSSAAQVAAAVAIPGLALAAVFVAAKKRAHPIDDLGGAPFGWCRGDSLRRRR